MLSTSGEMSFTFVWLSNFGSGCLIETTAAIPSSTSGPEIAGSLSFSKLLFFAYWFTARVSEPRKPLECVPPSAFGIAFVKHRS